MADSFSGEKAQFSGIQIKSLGLSSALWFNRKGNFSSPIALTKAKFTSCQSTVAFPFTAIISLFVGSDAFAAIESISTSPTIGFTLGTPIKKHQIKG